MFCKHYILYFFTALLFMSCQGNNKVVEFSETEYTDSVLLAPNNPKESPVCQSSIKLILLQAVEGSQLTENVEKINRYIIDEMLPNTRGAKVEDAAKIFVKEQIKEFANSVKNLYYEDLDYFYENNSQSDEEFEENKRFLIDQYCYESKINTEAHIGYADSVVCYKMVAYIYSGGAHPITVTTATSFSLKNGQPIRPVDLFRPETTSALIDRLTQRLMEMQNAESIEELQEMGFLTIADMFVSTDMLLESRKIVFHYDPYELAPYVFGDIDIEFSYDELFDLMNS